jgi:uncharacterized protein
MAFNPNARLDPSQVDDRRGSGRSMGGPLVIGGGGLGLVVTIIALLLGVNPGDILPTDQSQVVQQPSAEVAGVQKAAECQTGAQANERDDCRIVGYVDSVQKFWTDEFARHRSQYVPAQMVLFSGATNAACGDASTEMGPFYCPLDKKVYMDLEFFGELRQRFGASGGSFAQGYVVAHEYGHHVQNLLGLLNENGRPSRGPSGSSVRTELTADCLAGVWAHNAAATGYLQPPTDKDVADAMDAAAAVGDDRIQRQTQGRVTPESWTHGSSQQRQQAFMSGYRSGNVDTCTG